MDNLTSAVMATIANDPGMAEKARKAAEFHSRSSSDDEQKAKKTGMHIRVQLGYLDVPDPVFSTMLGHVAWHEIGRYFLGD